MAQARAETYRLASYASLYRRTEGRWPNEQELVAQRDDLPARDPWGNPYRVDLLPGDAAVIRCVGDDGDPNTCDDVVSPPATARDVAPRR